MLPLPGIITLRKDHHTTPPRLTEYNTTTLPHFNDLLVIAFNPPFSYFILFVTQMCLGVSLECFIFREDQSFKFNDEDNTTSQFSRLPSSVNGSLFYSSFPAPYSTTANLVLPPDGYSAPFCYTSYLL